MLSSSFLKSTQCFDGFCADFPYNGVTEWFFQVPMLDLQLLACRVLSGYGVAFWDAVNVWLIPHRPRSLTHSFGPPWAHRRCQRGCLVPNSGEGLLGSEKRRGTWKNLHFFCEKHGKWWNMMMLNHQLLECLVFRHTRFQNLGKSVVQTDIVGLSPHIHHFWGPNDKNG